MSRDVVTKTEFSDVKLSNRGKVRDIYDLDEHFLIVATDRISAFDSVLPNGIPDKGRVLTALSSYWFERTRDICENHMVSTNVEEFPEALQPYRDILQSRSMLVRKAKPLPVECVVRGYLSGSAWRSYQESGGICGISLPTGLKESDRLPEPLFTPATKAESGHDINIDEKGMIEIVGEETGRMLKETSLAIYREASKRAEERGIIISDTKFEFGEADGKTILIDELLTPDSSRFWPRDQYAPGGAQPSYDKQFVRDYLESIKWNKEPPAPPLPPEVIEKTAEKYRQAYRILTGSDLPQ